jgi:hypothetical protein
MSHGFTAWLLCFLNLLWCAADKWIAFVVLLYEQSGVCAYVCSYEHNSSQVQFYAPPLSPMFLHCRCKYKVKLSL